MHDGADLLLRLAPLDGPRAPPGTLGIAYGLLLYVVMNFIVVPLSAAGAGSRDPTWIALTVAVHAFLIGLPIALFASRAALSP